MGAAVFATNLPALTRLAATALTVKGLGRTIASVSVMASASNPCAIADGGAML